MVYDGYDRQTKWIFPSQTPHTGFVITNAATASATAGSVNAGDYEEYSYDDNGNRTRLRKRDTKHIDYTYDALNRMASKVIPTATATNVYYGYDNRGLQTFARFGSASGQGISTVYDGFGRVSSTSNNMDAVSRTLTYSYDKNSNRTGITHPDSQNFSYVYEGLNRSKIVYENSTWVNGITYNDQGQLYQRYTNASTSMLFGYDTAGRVNWFSNDIAGSANDAYFSATYTPASQMRSRSVTNDLYANTAHYNVVRNYQVNGLNQYTQGGPAAFTYDPNGNLTSDGSTNFTYDIENRLLSASGAKTATLKYDPLGRLYEIGGGATTTRFLYDGDALVAEYDATSGNMQKRYLHGGGVDNRIIWYEGAAVDAASRRHLFRNWQGSITAISDGTGAVVQVNGYDAYGIPNATNEGRFQYTGQILLEELGMYHYKARIYSPYLGRFLQTDPIGYEDQYNLYAYVANDPVNFLDPSGEKTEIHVTWSGPAFGRGAKSQGHLNIRLTPDDQRNLDSRIFNQIDKNGNRFATLSAGPKSVARALVDMSTPLVGEINRSEGRTEEKFNVKTPGRFKTENAFHQSLIDTAGRYEDDVDYDLFPSSKSAGRNSNSFVSGVLLENGVDIRGLGDTASLELPGVKVPLDIPRVTVTGSHIPR